MKTLVKVRKFKCVSCGEWDYGVKQRLPDGTFPVCEVCLEHEQAETDMREDEERQAAEYADLQEGNDG